MDANKSAFSQDDPLIELERSLKKSSNSSSKEIKAMATLGSFIPSFKTRIVSILPTNKIIKQNSISNDSKSLKTRSSKFERHRFKSPDLNTSIRLPRPIQFKKSKAKSKIIDFSFDNLSKRCSKKVRLKDMKPGLSLCDIKRKVYSKRNYSLYQQKQRNFSILKDRTGPLSPPTIAKPKQSLRMGAILSNISKNVGANVVKPMREVIEETTESLCKTIQEKHRKKREEKERSVRFSRLISPAPSNKGKSPLSNGRSLINNWQSPLSNGRSPPASNFENNKFEVDSRRRTTGQTDKKRKLCNKIETSSIPKGGLVVDDSIIEEEKDSSATQNSQATPAELDLRKCSNSFQREFSESFEHSRAAESFFDHHYVISTSPRGNGLAKDQEIEQTPFAEKYFSLDEREKKQRRHFNTTKQSPKNADLPVTSVSYHNFIYPIPFSSLSKKEKMKYRDFSFQTYKKKFNKRLKKMELNHRSKRKNIQKFLAKPRQHLEKDIILGDDKYIHKYVNVPKLDSMQKSTLMTKTNKRVQKIIQNRKKQSMLIL
ncbi:unnamed protein product [Moneuplotes crassus]|uniref:Uncharacterized protein n=1 Tax=Euplotes crassus TaxID=5936 RepID=A0AAD1Y9J0_EUPCR|nr:unnamed protein product [Moneuplotes crassus]